GVGRWDGKYDAGTVCDSRRAKWIEAGRRGAGGFAVCGVDGQLLRIADGDDGGEVGGAAWDYAARCGCLRFAKPAGGGCGVQGLPDSRGACAGGSEAGEEDDCV